MSVLLVNHKIENCGVYQYGLRFRNILSKSQELDYIYIEVNSYDEFSTHVNRCNDLQAIIYNYCTLTLPWLNSSTLVQSKKNIGLLHPGSPNFFDIGCNIDPNEKENPPKLYSIPRPIYENVDNLLKNHIVKSKSVKEFINIYTNTNLPIFGSFGLAAKYKGFAKMIAIVNSQYDNAVIKIQMPRAHYYAAETVQEEINRCLTIQRKPGIILIINNDFLSNEDLLLFLNSNTMNIFLYDSMGGNKNCISSVIDVVLGIKKPLAISNSDMFRNIYSDEICLYKRPISEILKTSVKYCDKFREDYSHKNVIDKFNKIIKN